MHVDVHGADGDALPRSAAWRHTRCVRYGTAWTGWVVSWADRCWVRIEDSIATISAEVKQRIEWRVPGTVRPDVIEDAVIGDAIAATHRHFAFSKRIPGKAKARTEIMVLGRPHPADRAYTRGLNARGVMRPIATSEVGKLRDNPVSLAWSAETFPAESQIKSESASRFPVVLAEHRVIARGVVTVSAGLVRSRNSRVNGRLFKVRIIAGKIRNRCSLRRQTRDRTVGLQSAVARGLDHCTRGACGVCPSADRGQLPELILPREP